MLKRLLFVALLASLLIAPAGALAEDEEMFADPNGLFAVPVPTNWTAEATDDYVLITDPDQLITVFALTTEAETGEAGIAATWEIINPDFDQNDVQSISPPSAPGVDETLVITYDTGDPARLAQAYAQRIGGVVYLLVFDGDLNALIQRNAQVQIIATGFQIIGQVTIDLSGVDVVTLSDEMIAELEAYTQALLERLEVPGAAVAVVENGEIVYTGAFGMRELGSDDPVTVDMQFMIGSTTKPLTTTMMASEIDSGILTWDTPVIELLPSFEVADEVLTQEITVRNLVCACTGVPRKDFEFLFNANQLTAQDVVDSLSGFEFFTEFGEAFQYSNQMVATGGYAAAAAADPGADLMETYLAQMQARIFDPIGMDATTFSFEVVEARASYASPHGVSLVEPYYRPIPLSAEATLIPVTPAGAAWSTVEDMAHYVITMINRGVAPDGTRVVSEENLLETWQPQVAVTADINYGLGWFIDDYKGVTLLNHGGNTLGFTSDLAFLPDAGVGIVVLTNGQASNIFNLGVRNRLLELLYQQPMTYDEEIAFIIEQAEAAEAELVATVGESPAEEDVADYLGRWYVEALGEVEVRYEDGLFILASGEFISELRTNLSEEAEPKSYLMIGVPVAGLNVRFTEADGVPQMVFSTGASEFYFVRAD